MSSPNFVITFFLEIDRPEIEIDSTIETVEDVQPHGTSIYDSETQVFLIDGNPE